MIQSSRSMNRYAGAERLRDIIGEAEDQATILGSHYARIKTLAP